MPEIATKTIHCAGGLPAFLALPATEGQVPAVVLMHERYGLVPHTRDLAQRLARDGFVCIAPDFFYRHPDQAALHRGDVGYDMTDPEAADYLEAAIVELSALPQVDPSKIAVMGVCQTGRHPLVLAAQRPIAAALIWYGAASKREWQVERALSRAARRDHRQGRLARCSGIFGEADHVISLDDVRRLRDTLDRHDKSYTIKVYAGAPHGWLNDTMPGRYRRAQAEAGWALQRAFLASVLDPGYDRSRRAQVYECDHAADYDFTKNVRMELMPMARDFEDHCWKDVIDADTIQIYQAYRRNIYVGDNPAVLAIDLYNKAYRGGDRPVKEVDREFSGSCGEHAWKAMAPTQTIARGRAPRRPADLLHHPPRRHVGVHSTNRNIGREADDTYDIKAELAPAPGELVIYKERASAFFGTPLIAHLQQQRDQQPRSSAARARRAACAPRRSTPIPTASTTWWSRNAPTTAR